MSEAAILKSVLAFCKTHPKVKMAWRQNSGVANIGGRHVRFGEAGHSDIHGFLKDGRFLAIECKERGEHPTELQEEFLDAVCGVGGVSGIAQSVEDAAEILRRA